MCVSLVDIDNYTFHDSKFVAQERLNQEQKEIGVATQTQQQLNFKLNLVGMSMLGLYTFQDRMH